MAGWIIQKNHLIPRFTPREYAQKRIDVEIAKAGKTDERRLVRLLVSANRSYGLPTDSPAFSGRPLPEQTPAGLWVVDHGKVAATYGSRWH